VPLGEPTKEVLDKIRPIKNLRVIERESPIIFLCGGKVANLTDTPTSHRDKLLRHLSDHHPNLLKFVHTAEEFNSLLQQTKFEDWQTFETHLASLSSLIIIILESAGSIAEFGMFSTAHETRRKLLIVLDSKYYKEKSFIVLGPIKLVEKISPNHVCSFDMNNDHGANVDNNYLESIVSDVKETLDGQPRTSEFDQKDDGHLMFLVASIVDVFKAITNKELKIVLDKLCIEINKNTLEKYIELLTMVGLLERYRYSNQVYLVSKSDAASKVDILSPQDMLECSKRLMDYYDQTASENRRMRAINSVWNTNS